MITLKTVFVLGAGASVPYSFPTGRKLSEQLIRELEPRRHLHESLRSVDFKTQEIDEFKYAFSRSARNSVDAFLEHRTELMNIGKAAIAVSLMWCEREKTLFNNWDDARWMRVLYNRMSCEFDRFGEIRVVFVTFNYDRSLEHFLHSALQYSFGRSPEECAAQMARLDIIHLHGSLGKLPWQGPNNSRPYDPDTSPENIRIASQSIKIIHESIDDGRDKDFERAKQLMTDADRVYFMGFGFSEANVARLGISQLDCLRDKAFSTAVGLTDREMSDIRGHLCGGNIGFRDGLDCTGLLRNAVDWF